MTTASLTIQQYFFSVSSASYFPAHYNWPSTIHGFPHSAWGLSSSLHGWCGSPVCQQAERCPCLSCQVHFYQNLFIYLFLLLEFSLFINEIFKANCNGLSFSCILIFSVVGSSGKARTKMLISPRWSQKLNLQLHYHIGSLILSFFWTIIDDGIGRQT